MLFNSFRYALFLPIVFILYWSVPHRFRWVMLLAASYYFYMSWNVKYVFLILLTTVISYLAGLALERFSEATKRKLVLAVTVIVSMGTLFTFKYFNFFMDSVNSVFSAFALPIHTTTLNLLLPVGISFYTFQTLSYVIDVYRGSVKAEHHFGIYATFISFFPQLVAGPIERTSNLLIQIKDEHKFDYSQASYGMKLMAWGFFKKLAVADVIAVYVDSVYENVEISSGFDMLLAVLFFTVQIYCDFSGYSDIAIGSAKLMGINLMTNFRSPYFSASIKEFWSRWHISLSTWFKDYIYIPLGGNRCSKPRHYLNLIITFLVSGLWHGANWTFIIWGFIHGISQVFEEIFFKKTRKKNESNRLLKVLSVIGVFIFCNFTWIFFRAESLKGAVYFIYKFVISFLNPSEFFSSSLGISAGELTVVFLSILLLALYDFKAKNSDVIDWISSKKAVIRWSVYFLLIILIIFRVPVANSSEFIYFQF